MGPFHKQAEFECRSKLPRCPRYDRRRKQGLDLGARSLAGTPRGNSQGAKAVMGLRAKNIVLSSSAAKSLEDLQTGSDPNPASIVRRIRALKPILLADCLHGEVVRRDRIPKAPKARHGLENLFVED